MTPRALRPGWILIALVVLGGLAYAARSAWNRRATETPGAVPPVAAIPDSAVAPPGVRVRVQVLNATRRRGLARSATRYLRGRGFDVVETGNVGEQRDSTLVLDRSGNPTWAGLVAAALGRGRVESRPDSSRYLDVTVLLGASWRAPTQPLDP